MKKSILREIIEVGRFLFEAGVVDYFSGNLSVFDGKRIFVTRSGSPLPLLTERDILEIKPNRPIAGKPSSELVVHRAVYEKTPHRAVAHAHPPAVVKLAFSLGGNFYTPRDSEAKLLLGEVPILRVEKPSASEELAEAVSEALRNFPCAIVYSHGVFCAAQRLRIAAGFITALEFSAKVFGW